MEWTEKFSKRLDSSFPLVSYNWDALATSSGSKHYALGGSVTYIDGGEKQSTTEQLVTYDYKTETFKNETHPFHAYGGEAQFVPHYGEEGVILFFGGIQRADRTISNEGVGVANLSTIQVYDVHTGTFYNQTATNARMERYEFCSVGGEQCAE